MIRSIHWQAQLSANTESNNDLLIAHLEATDTRFRSIAYEGASVSRGLLDISIGGPLIHWSAYRERTKPHTVQVHIGLGWAISQRQVPFLSYLNGIEPLMQARVLDGYGYYEGMFRNRTSVRDKIVPPEIKDKDLHAYDQGIGRALWYMAKGNIEQLLKLIDGFADSRKPDLWRGVGIAASYVGGSDELVLTSLFDLSGSYQRSLASGAVFLAHSRQDAGTLNEEAEMTCRKWCGLSTGEAISLMDRTEPSPGTSDDDYVEWVGRIEKGLIIA